MKNTPEHKRDTVFYALSNMDENSPVKHSGLLMCPHGSLIV